MILGIAGKAEVGKSTVAKAIVKTAVYLELDAKVYELSNLILAETIEAGTIDPKVRSECTPEDIQELIRLGGARRKENPDYWIGALLVQIKKDNPEVAVCPNIRFPSESTAIQNAGGKIIKVTALNADGSEFTSRSRDPNDPSETSQRQILADYFLSTKRGESELLKLQAAALFKYIQRTYAR